MKIAIVLLTFALLIWFWGCIKTYRINGKVLVDGMGFISLEFKWLILFLACLLCFFIYEPIGKWIYAIFLFLWIVIQFFCHWFYTIFGATTKKIKSYNSCFKDTIHIFSPSEARIIPDLYHMILHSIITLLFVLIMIYNLERS